MNQRPVPDPRRVEAGRRNRAKRKGLTPAGLERLRQSALEHEPWRYSTGPISESGRRVVAANGRRRCRGEVSIPEAKAEVARAGALIGELAVLRMRLLSQQMGAATDAAHAREAAGRGA